MIPIPNPKNIKDWIITINLLLVAIIICAATFWQKREWSRSGADMNKYK